jgi:predicted RNase H-like nuclease
MLAVGVDGCAAGWVGVALDEHGFAGSVLATTIDHLASELPGADGFGIDIPIGLLAEGFRAADRLARRQVGPRAASVFLTPPRAVLEIDDHQRATLLAVQLAGSGISRQAHGLRHKILEVDRWLRARPGEAEHRTVFAGTVLAGPGVPSRTGEPDGRRNLSAPPVWEVHPEVSFSLLAGGHLPPKNSWNGAARRHRLLRDAGVVLPDDLQAAGRVKVDDVLDAAAVAWSCRRLLRGEGRSWPDPPQVGPDGWPIAIWA